MTRTAHPCRITRLRSSITPYTYPLTRLPPLTNPQVYTPNYASLSGVVEGVVVVVEVVCVVMEGGGEEWGMCVRCTTHMAYLLCRATYRINSNIFKCILHFSFSYFLR